MPRKKVDALASVPNVPAGELMHRIASEMTNMPPAAYGLAIKTNDQEAIWRSAKHFYKCVACVLDSYISGGKRPDYSGMSKELRQAIDNETWAHLSLYSLIFFNWDAIAPHLKNVSAPEMPLISGRTLPIKAKDFASLDSPVEMFLEAAKHRAIGHIHYAFSDHRTEFIPYRVRKDMEDNKTLSKANAPKTLVALKRTERLRIYEERQWIILENLCVALAEKSKPAKGSAAKQAIDSYKISIRSEEALVAKRMHKTKKPQKIVWENGYQTN